MNAGEPRWKSALASLLWALIAVGLFVTAGIVGG